MRLIRLNIVVLPAPFGPMMENTSPCSTWKLTASTARMPPKRMAISLAAKMLMGGHTEQRRWARWPPPPLPQGEGENSAASPQTLRARVGLLPTETGAALERVGLKPVLQLYPAAIDAARLEQDHHHQHEAEQRRLQPRHATDPKRQLVAHDGDGLGHQPDEDRAENRAVQRAQAAYEDDGDELHRQQHVERIGCEKPHVMREQCAGQAGHAGADGERERLVPREMNAHALGGDL